MGGKPLTRYIIPFLAILLLSLPLQAELSRKNIEKMVQDIKAKRSSKLGDDAKIASPFITVRQEDNSSVQMMAPAEKTQSVFSLGAIVNSTAFIDGAWRKVGDAVGDFKVKSVNENHVVLKRENRTITLFFKPTKHIINTGKE